MSRYEKYLIERGSLNRAAMTVAIDEILYGGDFIMERGRMKKFCIYGRVSVDNGWYLCKSGVGEDELAKWLAHYRKTWRYVKGVSYDE
nr:MAG: hypothetical protein [Bacteriophage sp.]